MANQSILPSWKLILLVAFGGMGGASLRFLLGAISGEAYVMTMGVNIVGSFGLGFVLFSIAAKRITDLRIQALLATGFFGSFTTYSTLIADIFYLPPLYAGGYIAVTYFGGISAILFSRRFAYLIFDSTGEKQ